MEYDRGDRFIFDVELDGSLFGSKSNGNLSPLSYSNKLEKNWKSIFMSARRKIIHK